MKKVVFLLIAGAAVISCNNNASTAQKPDILAANLDTTVNPGQDIFDNDVPVN